MKKAESVVKTLPARWSTAPQQDIRPMNTVVNPTIVVQHDRPVIFPACIAWAYPKPSAAELLAALVDHPGTETKGGVR
jgi:hypothetical protein